MKVRLLTLALALAFAGCVESRIGNRTLDEAVGPGAMDSRRSLVARWGNPDARDGDTWTWKVVHTDGAMLKGDLCGLPLFEVSRLHGRTVSTSVTFGPNGYVQSVKRSNTAPGLPTWGLNPLAD